jgi:hypothetical protein
MLARGSSWNVHITALRPILIKSSALKERQRAADAFRQASSALCATRSWTKMYTARENVSRLACRSDSSVPIGEILNPL